MSILQNKFQFYAQSKSHYKNVFLAKLLVLAAISYFRMFMAVVEKYEKNNKQNETFLRA